MRAEFSCIQGISRGVLVHCGNVEAKNFPATGGRCGPWLPDFSGCPTMNARSSVQVFLTLFRLMLTVSLLVRGNCLHSDEPAIPKPVPQGDADSNGSADEATPSKDANRPVNRLSRESSPYLLMHAHNPIQWFPWGPEAFEKARAEDKPVFLSIGYSSCYWCHVMEREVFSSDRIAEYMNTHFVCIKVDREERPDIDDLYMTSLIVYQQAAGSGGGGGWPLSLFLDNEGNPIAGATYLPPEDTPDGRTGFLTAATRIQDLWKNQRESVLQTSGMIAREVRRLSGPTVLAEPVKLDAELLKAVTAAICQNYDEVWGGVDLNRRRPDGPRFPSVPRLMFLLQQFSETQDPQLMSIVRHSLTAMARGGIRDHLGGGFHRYSTERPHFEKMLYDNALLAATYTEAWQLTGEADFARVARETLDYLIGRMTDPVEGGFFATEDADSEGVEGKFYVWAKAEVEAVLGVDRAARFCTIYDISPEGNWESHNIPNLIKPLDQVAVTLGTTEEELRREMDADRAKLLSVRDLRVPPSKDTKVLASWNGLALAAFADAAWALGEPRYLAAAERCAAFVKRRMVGPDGLLLHSFKDGQARFNGYLDDYAALIDGLTRLYEAGGDRQWLDLAEALSGTMIAEFWDDADGGFFYTGRSHEVLILRNKDYQDNATPSGNALAATALARLGRLTGDSRFTETAWATLKSMAAILRRFPMAAGQGLVALDFLLARGPEVVVVSPLADDDYKQARRLWAGRFMPGRVTVGNVAGMAEGLELAENRGPVGGRVTSYVCSGQTCEAPVAGVEALAERLAAMAAYV